jgi:hypothetical protein
MMMLVMFCATAKVKVLMQHPEAPKVVRDANNILHQCCGTLSWEAFATDVKILNAVSNGSDVLKWSVDSSQKEVSPPANVQHELMVANVGLEPSLKITMFLCCTVLAIRHTTQAVSRCDSSIFFKGSGRLVPGVIEYIFSVPSKDSKKTYYIAARKNLPVSNSVVDPFQMYEDFRASLWRDKYGTDLDIVPIVGSVFCHTISMAWEYGVVVMKPLDKVSDDK